GSTVWHGCVSRATLFLFVEPCKKTRNFLAKAGLIWCNIAPLGNGSRPIGHSSWRDSIMSKVVTPPMAQPASQVKVPQEKIAMRAYEKWCQRGRPQGTHLQDWYEAEAELRGEYARTGGSAQARR